MTFSSIPSAGMHPAFEQAARAHEQVRSARAGAQQGASRQIAAAQGATPVERAIANAAEQTSVDFDYLVAQAQVESSMNPDARARASSATGLYQFIESTWLGTMERHGPRFGLGEISAQIARTAGGRAYVADPQARQAILALRRDPQIASLMAAGLAEDNRAHLAPILGRQPDHSELYLAHFLGAGGAGRFLSALQQDPSQRAAALFRRPAATNPAIFYEANGRARSLADVMDHLSGKLERARIGASGASTPAYGAASLAPPIAAPPYIIADEAVFAPRNPPQLTQPFRPTIRPVATLPLSGEGSRPPMSDLLRGSFSPDSRIGSTVHNAQVERAYERLKALGL